MHIVAEIGSNHSGSIKLIKEPTAKSMAAGFLMPINTPLYKTPSSHIKSARPALGLSPINNVIGQALTEDSKMDQPILRAIN